MQDFFAEQMVSLISSWRDTGVQLTALLVARRQGIPFVIPTRIRIPQEVYGFCTGQFTDTFLKLREAAPEDFAWAERFLSQFENRVVKPALKKATRDFADIFQLMPSHLRAFSYEIRRAIWDAGNDYSRYTLPALVGMYFRRRLRLMLYKAFNPTSRVVPEGPFCLYALHTQPESSIDVQASYYSDQVALVRMIARSLPASHMLVVKVHPTDVDGKSLRYYHAIRSIPGVVLLDYSVDSRWLVERAAIVFALTGTIAYEAALLGKPVVAFTRNFFNSLPTVSLCEAPFRLPALIGSLIQSPPSNEAQRARIVSVIAKWRASSFDGEVSRTYGAANEPLRVSDLAVLQKAYRAVIDALDAKPAR